MSQVAADTALGSGPDLGSVASGARIVGKTPWQLFWGRFRSDKVALVGVGFIVALVALALASPLIAKIVGHGANELFTREMTDEFGLPSGPNSEFYFGADSAGRDLFVRVLYGTRTSLFVALVATGISVMIGVILGMTAGYFGGAIDTVISRGIDIIYSMPLLVFALGLVGACSTSKEGCFGGLIKPGLPLVIFVIALFSWPYIARIVRGNTLSIKQKEFVEASRAVGATDRRIIFKEVLPNLVAPIVVYSSLIIPSNVLFEAYLSFLGLGLPQRIPSWGRMLSDAARLFDVAWWMMVFPGIFLLLTVLAFNLVGDGLRDALDPRTGR